jgi:hypothetical protein
MHIAHTVFHMPLHYCRDGTGTVARVPVFPGVGPLSNDIAGKIRDFTRLHYKKLVSL